MAGTKVETVVVMRSRQMGRCFEGRAHRIFWQNGCPYESRRRVQDVSATRVRVAVKCGGEVSRRQRFDEEDQASSFGHLKFGVNIAHKKMPSRLLELRRSLGLRPGLEMSLWESSVYCFASEP